MLDDDLPDHETVYARAVKGCRRMGIEPVSRERVRELVVEWNRRIVDRDSDAPTRFDSGAVAIGPTVLGVRDAQSCFRDRVIANLPRVSMHPEEVTP